MTRPSATVEPFKFPALTFATDKISEEEAYQKKWYRDLLRSFPQPEILESVKGKIAMTPLGRRYNNPEDYAISMIFYLFNYPFFVKEIDEELSSLLLDYVALDELRSYVNDESNYFFGSSTLMDGSSTKNHFKTNAQLFLIRGVLESFYLDGIFNKDTEQWLERAVKPLNKAFEIEKSEKVKFILGVCYDMISLLGKDSARYRSEAERYFFDVQKSSFETGTGQNALYRLGICQGRLDFILEAARGGARDAQILMGAIFNANREYGRAITLLNRVAKAVDSKVAKLFLGFAYHGMKDHKNALLNFEEVVNSFKKFKRSKMNDEFNSLLGEANFIIGFYYFIGCEGVEKDLRKAYKYFKQSAEEGNKQAKHIVFIYLDGQIVDDHGRTVFGFPEYEDRERYFEESSKLVTSKIVEFIRNSDRNEGVHPKWNILDSYRGNYLWVMSQNIKEMKYFDFARALYRDGNSAGATWCLFMGHSEGERLCTNELLGTGEGIKLKKRIPLFGSNVLTTSQIMEILQIFFEMKSDNKIEKIWGKDIAQIAKVLNEYRMDDEREDEIKKIIEGEDPAKKGRSYLISPFAMIEQSVRLLSQKWQKGIVSESGHSLEEWLESLRAAKARGGGVGAGGGGGASAAAVPPAPSSAVPSAPPFFEGSAARWDPFGSHGKGGGGGGVSAGAAAAAVPPAPSSAVPSAPPFVGYEELGRGASAVVPSALTDYSFFDRSAAGWDPFDSHEKGGGGASAGAAAVTPAPSSAVPSAPPLVGYEELGRGAGIVAPAGDRTGIGRRAQFVAKQSGGGAGGGATASAAVPSAPPASSFFYESAVVTGAVGGASAGAELDNEGAKVSPAADPKAPDVSKVVPNQRGRK